MTNILHNITCWSNFTTSKIVTQQPVDMTILCVGTKPETISPVLVVKRTGSKPKTPRKNIHPYRPPEPNTLRF